MNDKMYKSNIKPLLYSKIHLLLSMCVVLFIVCLYICVCECLLHNNNHKTKHKNNTNCGSVFLPAHHRFCLSSRGSSTNLLSEPCEQKKCICLHFHTPAHKASGELDSCELSVFRSHCFLLLLLRLLFNKHPQIKQKKFVPLGDVVSRFVCE